MEENRKEAEDGLVTALRCTVCGHMSTTFAVVCSHCHSDRLDRMKLEGGGRVRSFTILNVPSEMFAADAPYAYAVIEMDEGCSLSGWMPGVRSARDISVNDRVRFTRRKGQAVVFEKV